MTKPPVNIKKLPDRVSAGPKDRDHRPHSSVLNVANVLAESDAVVGDRQVMIQMVSVFAA